MKILLVSYGIKEYDGRLAEIYKTMQNLGEVKLVCMGNEESTHPNEFILTLEGNRYLSAKSYISFVLKSLRIAKSQKDIDILVSDNLFAAFPSLLISFLIKPEQIIQDVRELYQIKDIKSFSGKLFCWFELKLMQKADIVLSANRYRADIMQKFYNLKRKPLVFENIRFLKETKLNREIIEKYQNDFKYKFNIVSTGGWSVARGADNLVQSLSKLDSDYGLYIIGEGTQEDKVILNNIIRENKLNNIHFIQKVPLEELQYIVSKCQIGIVHYHDNDLNNKYCASGKIYEYLAEGLPIVTTENIPLKDFCDENKVGFSDNSFSHGIQQVSDNYDYYRKNVERFISSISVEKYNREISNEIKSLMSSEVKN